MRSTAKGMEKMKKEGEASSMEQTEQTTPLLSVRGLDIAFVSGKQLTQRTEGVHFDVYPGEIVSLVGESGCGKSITALSLMGLLGRQGRVTHGEAMFQGRNLLAMDSRALDAVRGKEMAMIFQDIMYSLNPVFTIGNQLTEGMRRHLHLPREEARKQGVDLLEKTGIHNPKAVMRKYPHQLSGGMRQRVMIAMALSCKPKLLIADEPTTALDVTIQLQIMQLLQKLRDETGMAILLITHDLGVVSEIADRVVVMYAGQCVESADVRTLLENPAHPYTRALMQAIPSIHDKRDKRLYAIPGTVPEHYEKLTGCRFAPRCPYGDACPCEPLQERLLEGDKHWVRCCRGAEKAGVRHA